MWLDRRLMDLIKIEHPIVLARDGEVHLQLHVGLGDERQRRPFAVHTRSAGAAPDAPWTRHATGRLAPKTEPRPADLHAWPPGHQ